MKIERHWEDCCIYLVGFMVEDKKKSTNFQKMTKTIHKTIVLDTGCIEEGDEEKRIEILIFERFANVMEIKYIDVWTDTALRAKEKL